MSSSFSARIEPTPLLLCFDPTREGIGKGIPLLLYFSPHGTHACCIRESTQKSKGVGSMRAEKDEDMECLQLRAESKKFILLPWFSAAVPEPAWFLLLMLGCSLDIQ